MLKYGFTTFFRFEAGSRSAIISKIEVLTEGGYVQNAHRLPLYAVLLIAV